MATESLERFDIRLPASAKQMLLMAAELNGSSLTALIISAAMDKAREIVQANQMLTLNLEDWERFTASLDNPPPPNTALKQAWQEYQAADIHE
ncbi:DUF1778 domain-containing protein [Thiofilum flexile]|uniref:type II toxin-antitoxin system TacA family antitoxin n=1 Tax=Thiofilum flexile TaxID=125627 RepID=UPI00036CAA9F|nr:DUF1778 domain-containing protein [Thiofilum flexile]